MNREIKSNHPEISKFERIAKLFLLLLHTATPLSLDQIVREVSGYPKDNHENQRQMFERDKKELRDGGIEIKAYELSTKDQYGYKIDTENHYITLPDFTPEEKMIINLALSAVTISDINGRIASVKLGILPQNSDKNEVMTLESAPFLSLISNSLKKGFAVDCIYSGRPRYLIPAFLQFSMGKWYLHGCQVAKEDSDRLFEANVRSAKKTGSAKKKQHDVANIAMDYTLEKKKFRLDKITSIQPTNTKIKDEVRKNVYSLCKNDSDDTEDLAANDNALAATIQLSGADTDLLKGWLDHGAQIISTENNLVTIKTLITNDPKRIIPHLLTFGDKIGITEPESIRQEIASYLKNYLDSIREAAVAPCVVQSRDANLKSGKAAKLKDGAKTKNIARQKTQNQKTFSPIPESVGRLNELLSIVLYMTSNHPEFLSGPHQEKYIEASAGIKELSEIFQIDTDTLVKRLEAASLLGIPPYGPENLLELLIEPDSDSVKLTLTEEFMQLKNSPGLTSEESLSLVAALKSLLAIVDPSVDKKNIVSCIEKLEPLINANYIDIDLRYDEEEKTKINLLKRLAENRQTVDIFYPEKTDLALAAAERPGGIEYRPRKRRVTIFQVALREGKFYLDGYCHLANDFRRFSVAKITKIEELGPEEAGHLTTADNLPEVFHQQSAFAPGSDSKIAKIEVPPDKLHLFRQYQYSEPQINDNGNYVLDVVVGDPGWLGSLLLGAGPGTRVITPEELANAGKDLAETLYKLYGP